MEDRTSFLIFLKIYAYDKKTSINMTRESSFMAEELKMIFIISSGMEARGKALAGLRMAINMKKKGRASDVRLLFFGPSEEMIAKGGEDIDGMLKEAAELDMYRTACVFIAQQHKIDQTLTAKGVKLEPAGEVLAKAMKEDCVPITF